jgi:AcrR family transcriptional regulator
MPRLIETESRTDAVVAAVNHLLATAGPTSLSIRSIARESGVSGSSLLHHYGTRRRIVVLSAIRTGKARLRDIDARLWREGVHAFLPADLDGVVDARVWLAWAEMWRSEESLTTAIESLRQDERALLAAALDYQLARDELTALTALIDGLLVGVCAPVRPLPLPRAATILGAQVEHALARERDLRTG